MNTKDLKQEIYFFYLKEDFSRLMNAFTKNGVSIEKEKINEYSTFKNKEYVEVLIELLTDAEYYK